MVISVTCEAYANITDSLFFSNDYKKVGEARKDLILGQRSIAERIKDAAQRDFKYDAKMGHEKSMEILKKISPGAAQPSIQNPHVNFLVIRPRSFDSSKFP